MGFAKMIREDDDAFVVLINKEDYDKYVKELQAWLDAGNVPEKDTRKKIKKILLTDDKI